MGYSPALRTSVFGSGYWDVGQGLPQLARTTVPVGPTGLEPVTIRIPKRHVFEFPFEIPAPKAPRLGRPRANRPQHNSASEQIAHQLHSQRETKTNPSASLKAAYNAKRISLGLCCSCSNQVEDGKRYCPSCSKKRGERIAQLRNGRKDLGLCQDCGETAISGLTRCLTCVERRRENMRRLRAKRNLLGICQNCSNKAIPEQNLCASCAEKQRARTRRNKQTIKDAKNG